MLASRVDVPDAKKTAVAIVDPERPEPATIERAATILKRGGLVAFPTETVYGLGAKATTAESVSRIFEAKRRPASDPLIVHIAAIEELHEEARAIPETAIALAQRFWPGPLTLVLPRRDTVPAIVSAGRSTIAVRTPRHPVALALVRAAGFPIAAPSANLFARPSPTRAEHVLEDLAGRIELVLDAGPVAVGLESTVLDLTSDPPQVLRPGGVALEELQAVLPACEYRPRYAAEAEPSLAAPGMLLKHYSPRAELLLFQGPPERTLPAMRRRIRQRTDEGQRVGALVFEEDRALLGATLARWISLGSEADPATVGRALFAGLRELDRAGVDTIVMRATDGPGLWRTIWDRLLRAAEGRVIQEP